MIPTEVTIGIPEHQSSTTRQQEYQQQSHGRQPRRRRLQKSESSLVGMFSDSVNDSMSQSDAPSTTLYSLTKKLSPPQRQALMESIQDPSSNAQRVEELLQHPMTPLVLDQKRMAAVADEEDSATTATMSSSEEEDDDAESWSSFVRR
uniref:Uncharacterized protein n=1 Tax=Entomoneis paludosa TaxID=265537 RepID=A0A7S3DRQ1_9STRA|mmetsp:Transcript_31541/g.65882  ORF Transcript_31541/g.65882 Transcript_31541/m.65882 type:complete len:148 (+) Transcript_31541:112-555(+)